MCLTEPPSRRATDQHGYAQTARPTVAPDSTVRLTEPPSRRATDQHGGAQAARPTVAPHSECGAAGSFRSLYLHYPQRHRPPSHWPGGRPPIGAEAARPTVAPDAKVRLTEPPSRGATDQHGGAEAARPTVAPHSECGAAGSFEIFFNHSPSSRIVRRRPTGVHREPCLGDRHPQKKNIFFLGPISKVTPETGRRASVYRLNCQQFSDSSRNFFFKKTKFKIPRTPSEAHSC